MGLVTRVIIRVTNLITPIKVLITLLTKSHDPPSNPGFQMLVLLRGSGDVVARVLCNNTWVACGGPQYGRAPF